MNITVTTDTALCNEKSSLSVYHWTSFIFASTLATVGRLYYSVYSW